MRICDFLRIESAYYALKCIWIHTYIHIQAKNLGPELLSVYLLGKRWIVTREIRFKLNKDTLLLKKQACMNCKASQNVYMIAESYVIQYSYL